MGQSYHELYVTVDSCMAIPIRAVIFDYGKVLSAPQKHADLAAMAAILKLTTDQFEPFYWRYRMDYDRADLDAVSYWSKIAADAHRELNDTQIAELRYHDVEGWSESDPVMVGWATRLRESGVPIAVLSNMPADLREHVTLKVDWFPQFDHMTFSCDVHSCKPDAAIYEHCLHGLKAAPSDTIFLDDRPENVDGAKRVGIRSFIYTTPREARKIIEREFSLPVSIEC